MMKIQTNKVQLEEYCRECEKAIFNTDTGYFEGLCPQCFINEDFDLDIDRDW